MADLNNKTQERYFFKARVEGFGYRENLYNYGKKEKIICLSDVRFLDNSLASNLAVFYYGKGFKDSLVTVGDKIIFEARILCSIYTVIEEGNLKLKNPTKIRRIRV
jgi:hypothetical protein